MYTKCKDAILLNGPIYNIKVPNGGSAGYKDIVINVTKSASSFTEPGEQLKIVLDKVLRDSRLEILEVLEYGAGKLRNIPMVLRMDKSVCAVEFEELRINPIARENIRKSEKYGTKFRLLSPSEFFRDNRRFDLAMLINVVPDMPLISERIELFEALKRKVKEEKYVLWFAQEEGDYRKIREAGLNECLDGIWMGKGREFKTFYKYYPVYEVDRMMASYGFTLFRNFSVEDNDARLYQKL